LGHCRITLAAGKSFPVQLAAAVVLGQRRRRGTGKLESSHPQIMGKFVAARRDDAQTGGSTMDLSGEGILVILFVGLIAGWLAGKVVQGTGFGIIGDIVVGIAGAFVATLLFPRLGFHLGSGLLSEIIYSAIGAVVLLLIVRLVRRVL